MSKLQFNRRVFLRGLGGAMIGLPLLEATHGKAWSAGVPVHKRFIIVYRHGGTVSNIGKNYVNTLTYRFDGSGKEQGRNLWAPLSTGESLAGNLGPIQNIFAGHESKLLAFTGIDNQSGMIQSPYWGDHGWCSRTGLTSAKVTCLEYNSNNACVSIDVYGPSIDQVLAQRLATQNPVPFPSVNLFVPGPCDPNPFYVSAHQEVGSQDDVGKAFNTYLANVSSGTPDPALVRQRQIGMSRLDGTIAQYQAIEPSLSTNDRAIVDAHLTHLRELEQRIAALATATCQVPAINTTIPYDPYNGIYDGQVGEAMADIIIAALKCGLTNVATLRIADMVTKWLGQPFGPVGYDMGHSLHHVASDIGKLGTQYPKYDAWIQEMIQNRQWCLGLFKRIFDALESVPEGTGTMLDNTVMLYMSDFSNGSWHTLADIPVLIAGSGGGYFRTGRHINCNVADPAKGPLAYQSRTGTHNLFTSILNAFGFTDTHFGVDLPELSFKGPIPNLT